MNNTTYEEQILELSWAKAACIFLYSTEKLIVDEARQLRIEIGDTVDDLLHTNPYTIDEFYENIPPAIQFLFDDYCKIRDDGNVTLRELVKGFMQTTAYLTDMTFEKIGLEKMDQSNFSITFEIQQENE